MSQPDCQHMKSFATLINQQQMPIHTPKRLLWLNRREAFNKHSFNHWQPTLNHWQRTLNHWQPTQSGIPCRQAVLLRHGTVIGSLTKFYPFRLQIWNLWHDRSLLSEVASNNNQVAGVHVWWPLTPMYQFLAASTIMPGLKVWSSCCT